MSSMPQNSQQSFLPTTIILPPLEKADEFNYVLTDFIKKIISSVNAKDIGQYVLQEIQNGQVFFISNDNQNFRSIYRKVINFGALPNSTTKLVQHGIQITDQLRFTRIYGCANHPNNEFLPLPFSSSVLAENILLQVDNQNVIIETAQDYSAFTDSYVILEYFKA